MKRPASKRKSRTRNGVPLVAASTPVTAKEVSAMLYGQEPAVARSLIASNIPVPPASEAALRFLAAKKGVDAVEEAAPRTRFKTYTVARARRQFARLLADVAAGCVGEIVDKGRAVASMLDSDTLETLEILANPEAMKAIRAAKAGRGKSHDLAELDAEWDAKARKRKAKP